MMQKPKPKHEIHVQITSNSSSGGILYIWCASTDAENWLQAEAKEFGNLYEPKNDERYFTLFVMPVYDVLEVATYIGAMGEDQIEELEPQQNDETDFTEPDRK